MQGSSLLVLMRAFLRGVCWFILQVVKRAMGVNVPMLFTDSGFLYDEGAEEKSEICTNVRNRAKVLVDLPGGGLKDNVQVIVLVQLSLLGIQLRTRFTPTRTCQRCAMDQPH